MTMEKHMWKAVTNSTTSNTKPSSRWGHSSCVIGQQIVLFGGYADSIYMNDVWVYHTQHLQWSEVKTFGSVPSQRSNSSFHYDQKNNRIIMFGGGGANKTRFNTIHMLDWGTKFWMQISIKQNQACPWERTYHSSELLYPYLVVYGGQGVADLDDMWIYNLESNKWSEVPINKNSIRPCGRRFHSSCLIGNTFFVIAGCYSKYRPLSDVFYIDLTNLVKTGSVQGLNWKQAQFKGSSFLTRWGHACASLQNKIYIFGGRFSNDLNDILVLDMQTMKMKTLKTPVENMPKPRRRACINFIGNCLIMFGGFNSQYFNDLHFINVTDGLEKPKKYSRKTMELVKMVNNKQNADIQIQTVDGQTVYCHTGLLRHNFQNLDMLQSFVTRINKKQSRQTLLELLQILYKGYGKHPCIQQYFKNLPNTQQQKQLCFIRELDKLQQQGSSLRLPKLFCTNIFSNKNMIRIINNNIIQLGDQQFGQFLQKNREQTFKDIEIVINDKYVLRGNKIGLACGSNFFKNKFLSKFKDGRQDNIVKIYIPNSNVVLAQATLNFIMLGILIVPQSMSYQSWIQLYELAEYFCLKQLCSIVCYTLSSKIQQSTVDQLLKFSTQFNLQKLALACARQKLKTNQIQPEQIVNKFIKHVYIQNRFEIKQKMMTKVDNPMKKKFSNMSTEGEKENYQTCNQ